jgi:mono/diheme cytochrome c family protein
VVQRGEYLARAADCAACHTPPNGQEFTGGYKFSLPFGTIYGPNITPDKATGIGDYTDDEFISALQRGVGRGGKHLYPAMPYTNYTLMTREDVLAIKAYLFSLTPVHAESPPNDLSFPYNQRWGMVFWNLLNNPDHRFRPDTAKSPAWNRGAYLAEALGHCQACHTPRNFMYGLESGRAYGGAVVQDWLAYNITSDKESGVGAWSDDDLAAYLSTGHAPNHGPASGPMAEAVDHSLRHLAQSDIRALVTYLRDVKPVRTETPPPRPVQADALGERVFREACVSCHLLDGGGRQTPYAALQGAHSVRDPNGTNLLQILVRGGAIATGGPTAFMPAFGGAYGSEELAAVANWTIGHFGQRGGAVTRKDVEAVPPPGPASAARATPGG